MGDVIKVDRWEPSYVLGCEVCGLKPVVVGIAGHRIVTSSRLCGPHYFGTAEALDPCTWNGEGDESEGGHAD